MEALEAGAVDVVTKPRIDTAQFLQDSRVRICDAAKAAASRRLKGRARPVPQTRPSRPSSPPTP